ncbi:MAG: fumarylacetoacetate hydrolase family protein, partial [Clostridia bacterium]|nr:fumarylacetoacetate hydrolase family protein [Clostridia bacterium]
YPGDVILTGTPQGCSKIASGDVVTISVQNIGSLTNPVK